MNARVLYRAVASLQARDSIFGAGPYIGIGLRNERVLGVFFKVVSGHQFSGMGKTVVVA